MSEFPRRVFIHAPGDIGQGLFHHEPHKGYNANVEYIRARIAAEREAELVNEISHTLIDAVHGDMEGCRYRLRAILAKHKERDDE